MAMSQRNPFAEVASGYRRYRPGYPPELFAWLAKQAPGRDLALDCGAGSGQASLVLSQHFDQVVTTDLGLSPLQHLPDDPRLLPLQCAAEAIPLSDGSLDLLIVAQALHWFRQADFFSEVRRLLRPQGILAVWSYGLMQINSELDEVVQHLYQDILGDYWGGIRGSVEQGYRNIVFPFKEISPPHFAMEESWDLPRLLGYLETWSALNRYRNAGHPDPMPEVQARLATAWGDHIQRKVCWPLYLRIFIR